MGRARATAARCVLFCAVATSPLLASCSIFSQPESQDTAALPLPAPSVPAVAASQPVASSQPVTTWPTHAWPVSTPEAQGLDANVLADAMDTIKARRIPVHSLLIERHGTIVLDAYFHPFADNQLHDVASITKSVISTLVGISVGKRQLDDLNAPAVELLPKPLPGEDAGKARITLAHLLSMQSGLDCSTRGGQNFLQQMEHSPHWTAFALERQETAEPGTTFNYCAGDMELVSAVLTNRTGNSAAAYAQRELFGPLGIEHVSWPTDADGVSHGFADLKLQPRDMAKLGYLWLHHGQWEGRQIVPASYLDQAFRAHANVGENVQYGYGMWIYPEHGPAGGPADIEANGHGGQRIAVIPSQDMVVVITGSGLDCNQVSGLVAAAVKSDQVLPPDPSGDARLELRVADAAQEPEMRLAAALLKTALPIPLPKPQQHRPS
jgi:CubicO group peptidase (beta-lactamase class C family)